MLQALWRACCSRAGSIPPSGASVLPAAGAAPPSREVRDPPAGARAGWEAGALPASSTEGPVQSIAQTALAAAVAATVAAAAAAVVAVTAVVCKEQRRRLLDCTGLLWVAPSPTRPGLELKARRLGCMASCTLTRMTSHRLRRSPQLWALIGRQIEDALGRIGGSREQSTRTKHHPGVACTNAPESSGYVAACGSTCLRWANARTWCSL
mmetsp:Transcript_16467/g.33108  ORF Transcript_16467/g.33108 Transcript_16467/m.33108 type:complete len:209 (+) Transcript_16467:154-780(+)